MSPETAQMSGLYEPQLTTLTRDECLELLRGAVVGRIGYVADGRAIIIPVNFALLDGDIVFCTAKGSKLSWLSLRGRVAFEADRAGWPIMKAGACSSRASLER